MQKKSFLFTLFVAAAVFGLLASCELPLSTGEGMLFITIPGASPDGGARRVTVPTEVINSMSYEIDLTGPGGREIPGLTAEAGEPLTVYLEPGLWDIKVRAFYEVDGEVEEVGEGAIEKVEIIAGQIKTVYVPMRVLEDILKPGGSVPPRLWESEAVVSGITFNVARNSFVGKITQNITYQWYGNYVNEDTGQDGWQAIPGAASPTYTPASDAQENYYYCKVTYETYDYNNTDENIEATETITSGVIAVYPNTRDGLQTWIKDTLDEGETIVELSGSSDPAKPVVVPIGDQITINDDITLSALGGLTLRRDDNFTAPMFRVADVRLTLKGEGDNNPFTLDGNEADSQAPLILVDGGELVMNEGVLITRNRNTKTGQYIEDGAGGGVAVGNEGTFTMNGGKITGNYANSVGGGVVVALYGSAFIMKDGEISGNSTYGSGGGVTVAYGGNFTMEGGRISGNNASAGGGGGVYIYEGTFTKSGNSIITGIDGYSSNGGILAANTAVDGDAVYYSDGSPTPDGIRTRHLTAGPGVNTNSQLYTGWDPEQDGSSSAPFLIYKERQLRKVGTGDDEWEESSHYKLEEDIDLTDSDDWIPLFLDGGSFNGNHKTIIGLTISDPTEDYQGMFGILYNNNDFTAEVKDLSLIDVNITGKDYVGGLAGHSYVKVSNVNVTGNVTGNEYVGGLAGNSWHIIENCYTNVRVEGEKSNAGGLVGQSRSISAFIYTEVKDCYAIGDVFGSAGGNTGGLIGINNGSVKNCYATGDVSVSVSSSTLNTRAGGLVGVNRGTVENCYATGGVGVVSTGNENYVGGLIGFNELNETVEGIVKNCYATGNVSVDSNGEENHVGGLVGNNAFDKVENCYAAGNVSVSGTGDYYYVGGLMGHIWYGTVEKCYAAGNVSVSVSGAGDYYYVGGLVGYIGVHPDYTTEVRNCGALNPAITTTTTTTVGRVAGVVSDGAVLYNFASSNIAGTWSSNWAMKDGMGISPGTGNTQYNSRYFWETTLGWDFTGAWEMGGDGLPKLRNAGPAN